MPNDDCGQPTPTTSTRTERTRVRRLPKRGRYDRETIDAILDEALVGHLAFADESGQPYAIPTLQARQGDQVWIHGSAASRALRTLGAGVPACLTVTLVDGLVLARSVFNHSMNYRSVVVLGRARVVEDEREKLAALEAFTERIAPGRWADTRPPTRQELKATTIMALPLTEASAKVRSGPPGDEAEDLELDVWAGVIPFETRRGEPIPAPDLRAGIELPAYLADYGR